MSVGAADAKVATHVFVLPAVLQRRRGRLLLRRLLEWPVSAGQRSQSCSRVPNLLRHTTGEDMVKQQTTKNNERTQKHSSAQAAHPSRAP